MNEEERAIRTVAEQGYAANIADAAERIKIQAAIADRALQSAVLANGGALVALFAFVNNGAARLRFDPHGMKVAFAGFAFGLALALIAHALAFVSQDHFYTVGAMEAERHQRTIRTGVEDRDKDGARRVHGRGMKAYGTGVVVFLLSIAAFLYGCYAALTASF